MSILVQPNSGRYGNQLFSYFFGRILSDELRFKLYGKNTYDINYDLDQSDYSSYESPIYNIDDNNIDTFNSVISDKSPKKIIVSGYLQKKEIYIPYRNKIKNWFNLKSFTISEKNVAMHIRLGDLTQTFYGDHINLLPLEYYEKALSLIDFDKLTICSDSPNHPMVNYFIKKYNANIFYKNEKDTISFLASHNNLILSQGTFSFWANFFCEGKKIINAIPKTGWNSDPNSNLLLFDNNRIHIKI